MLFSFIIRKLRYFFIRRNIDSATEPPAQLQSGASLKIPKNLKDSIASLKQSMSDAHDIKVHMFKLEVSGPIYGALVFIEGMVDPVALTDGILTPLKSWRIEENRFLPKTHLMDALEREALCAIYSKSVNNIPELALGCLSGNTVLLADGYDNGLVIESKGWKMRPISEPQSESVVRGPREGFSENICVNISLIRRKIRNGQLQVEKMTIGRKTLTSVCIMYMDGIANPKVVDTVKFRLKKLDVESVLETGYIEEYIEDAPFSPFGTVGYTEKPDVVAARLLDGRVAILVDGTPFVLTAPMLFIEGFQTSEDYYNRPIYASMVRLLRVAGFLLAVFSPAIYISLVSFHHELLPTTLLFTFAQAREGTPFPSVLEAIIMVFAFEILREAGVRLPRPVGQAISIVGALIMGEAAVSAGIVGAPMVIVVALTAVTGFMIPMLNDAVSLLRVLMMIMSSFLGFYGIAFGFLAMLIHLASLVSFGEPYIGHFDDPSDLKDGLVRAPIWSMIKRPKGIARGDTTRGHFFIPPLRPHTQDDKGGEP